MALAAFFTGLFATLTPWWTLVQAASDDLSFYLADTLRLFSLSSGVSVSLTYESVGMIWIQVLYTCLLALIVISLVFSVIAGVLAVLASLGRVRQPYWIKALRTFLVFALVLALAATIAGPTAQQTAFSREKSAALNICVVNPGGRNPCTAFWGSANVSGDLYTWGPGMGWFLTLSSTALLLAALFCWWRGGPKPVPAVPSVPAPAVSPIVPPAAVGGIAPSSPTL